MSGPTVIVVSVISIIMVVVLILILGIITIIGLQCFQSTCPRTALLWRQLQGVQFQPPSSADSL